MKQTSYLCCLAEYRISAGLTQSELARLVGCSKNSISSIERGEYSPRLDLAFRLSYALECPLWCLFRPLDSNL